MKNFAAEFQGLFFFSGRSLAAVFRPPFYWRELIDQLYVNGLGSLWLIVLTGAFAGQGFALAFANELAEFGAKDYLGRIMAISIIRELGPVLTGLMVAARVAAGITAEIGAMKSSNQLDAMTAFGIDPMRKLVVPRLVGLIILVPVLTIVTNVIALVGGWVIAAFVAKISTTFYWSTLIDRLVFGNLFIGIMKPFVFSFIIAFIACYKGFSSEGGTRGVGRATTESVVLSSISVLIMNFFITRFVWQAIRGFV